MKLANTKAIHDAISELVEMRRINAVMAQAFTVPLSTGSIAFDEDMLEAQTEKFMAHARDDLDYDISHDEAMMTIIVSQMCKTENIDARIFPADLTNEVIRRGRIFHEGDIESNQYFRNIHVEEHSCGRFTLTNGTFGKFQVMHYNTSKVTKDGIGIPALAVFDHDFTYPYIRENDETWMGVTPNEIFTMEKAVNEVSGNVLTLGLGLGYFAYMAALKDEVEHVTIIEREPDVIELFNKYLLPQFSCGDKITVINADAVEYMKNLEDGVFDHCFADIWISNADSEQYLKLKDICRKFKKTQMEYWIEDSIAQSLVGYVVTAFVEESFKSWGDGKTVPELNDISAEEQFKKDYIGNLLKDEVFERPSQIKWFADYKNLINTL